MVQANLGSAFLELQKYDEAHKLLLLAKKGNPALPLVHESLGRYYFLKNELSKSLESFEKCSELIPWEAFYHYWIGKVLYHKKEYAKAEESLVRALELNPRDLSPMIELLYTMFDQKSLDNLWRLALIYDTYLLRFYMSTEIEDLFKDTMEAISKSYKELAYQETRQKAIGRPREGYRHFLNLLLSPASSSVHELAGKALVSMYRDEKIRQEIEQEMKALQENKTENAAAHRRLEWVMTKIQERQEEDRKNQLKRLIVRMIVGQDVRAFQELDKWGRDGQELLEAILNDRKEELVVRFLVSKALLELGSYEALRRVKNCMQSTKEKEISLLCAVALKEKKFAVDENILQQGLKSGDPFVRAQAVRFLDTDFALLLPLLRDSDERVRVYAAQKLRNIHKNSEYDPILIRGCKSPNPLIRVYCCSKLWPWKNPFALQAIPLTTFSEIPRHIVPESRHSRQYIELLKEGLEDPYPLMRQLAASRIGMHHLLSLVTPLAKLMDDSNIMVRYQTTCALTLLQREQEKIIKLLFDQSQSILFRSAAAPILFFAGRYRNMAMLNRLKVLMEERNPYIGIFAIFFIGYFGKEMGHIALFPYLSHPNPMIRMAAANALIPHPKTSLMGKLNLLLKDSDVHVRGAAAACIIRIISRYNPFELGKMHKSFKKQSSEIRVGASFGYYFPVMDTVFNDVLFAYCLTQSKKTHALGLENYQIFRHHNTLQFFMQEYMDAGYQKFVGEKEYKSVCLKYLNSAIDMYPAPIYYYKRALLYEVENSLDKAIEDISQALASVQNEQYLLTFVRLLLKKKNYEQVLVKSDQLLRMSQRSVEGWLYRANAFYELKEFAQALEAYKSVYALKPNDLKPYIEMWNCYRKLRQYSQSLPTLVEAEKLFPSERTLSLRIAATYIQLGMQSKAIQYWQEKSLALPTQAECQLFPELAGMK
jgi:tetratricopeptide (TPR) repeat protein/HEAT repeat protein